MASIMPKSKFQVFNFVRRVASLGTLWCARVSKRMCRTTNWWAGFSFSCYSWSLASSRRVWRGLTTLLDSMREAIHALRCIFWCLRGTQSTLIDQTVVSRPIHCVFAYWLFRALALQRSSSEKISNLHFPLSTCETNKHSRRDDE